MQFNAYLLNLGATILRDFGAEAPTWTPVDVHWDPAGAAPPSELAAMTFEVTTLDDADPWVLEKLRASTASVTLGFESHVAGEHYQVAVPVGSHPSRAYAELASQLQDHLAESPEGWGLPLPRCPRHDGVHPLVPRDTSGHAAWWCSTDDTVVRQIPSS